MCGKVPSFGSGLDNALYITLFEDCTLEHGMSRYYVVACHTKVDVAIGNLTF